MAVSLRGPQGFDPSSINSAARDVRTNQNYVSPEYIEQIFDLFLSHTGSAHIDKSNRVEAYNTGGRTRVTNSGQVYLQNRSAGPARDRQQQPAESIAEYNQMVNILSRGGRGIANHNIEAVLNGDVADLLADDNGTATIKSNLGSVKATNNDIARIMGFGSQIEADGNGQLFLGGNDNTVTIRNSRDITFGDGFALGQPQSRFDKTLENPLSSNNNKITYTGTVDADKVTVTPGDNGTGNLFAGENGDFADLGAGDDTAKFNFVTPNGKNFSNSVTRLQGGTSGIGVSEKDTLILNLDQTKLANKKYQFFHNGILQNYDPNNLSSSLFLGKGTTRADEISIVDTETNNRLDYKVSHGSDKTGFENLEIGLGQPNSLSIQADDTNTALAVSSTFSASVEADLPESPPEPVVGEEMP